MGGKVPLDEKDISSAFVVGPVGVGSFRSSLRNQRKGSRSKPLHSKSSTSANVRASASSLSSNPDGGEYDKESIQEVRQYFEKMWHLVLVPTKSKRAECTCIWCQGTKLRRCSWCEGRGYRFELVEKSWDELSTDLERLHSGEKVEPMKEMPKVKVQCSACSGTKKLRCGYCRGSGIGSYGHAY